MSRLLDSAGELLRYSLVGGGAFAVDFGLLWGLTHGGLHYMLSAAAAFTAGLMVNYTLSVLWVFRRRAPCGRAVEFAVFAAVGIAGLGLNEAIMWLVAGLLGRHYLLSKIVSAAVVFVWNFAARKYLLFNGKDKY